MHTYARSKQSHRVKDLPLSKRPREKMLYKGAENVTDVDLIAILLGTGTKTKNAISLAQTFLQQYPLERLATASFRSLKPIAGIGKVKMLRLFAAFELGKRIFANSSLSNISLSSSKDLLLQVRDIVEKKQEYLIVLYVNARQQLIQKEIIAVGRLNALYIEPKEIFAPAFATPCYGIYIAHNHPSGDTTPSDDDIRFTANIQKAAEILGIVLLDHLIVCQTEYFSFKENKIEKSK